MESLRSLHSDVQEGAEMYRRDPDIVGLWTPLDSHKPEEEYIVIQKKDQSAELIIYKPGESPISIKGKIEFERMESGHPKRLTVFVANCDKERMVIGGWEF